jgi:hypothetical protein
MLPKCWQEKFAKPKQQKQQAKTNEGEESGGQAVPHERSRQCVKAAGSNGGKGGIVFGAVHPGIL